MKRALFVVIATLLEIGTTETFRGPGVTSATTLPRGPVVDWSLEAQRAIVPPPAGNGNNFPGEAPVYMGIVHVAMYDVAMAIQGGYEARQQHRIPPCANVRFRHSARSVSAGSTASARRAGR